MRYVFLCLLIVALSPLMLLGQRTSGTISGAVTDPSGAVVPNVKVTATNTATGAATTANANASGFYVIPNLQPGPYRLDVAAAGFQSYEQTGIVLQTGTEVSVDVSLQLGATSQKVTVTGAAPLVNTRDQTLSTAITPQFTEQLPLNGRNILQLMALASDTSAHAGSQYAYQSVGTRPEAASGFVTASGESRENSTAFYLNGGLNMDPFTQVANVYPNPDAVQEFSYETNSYSAKYGGLGGGVVNAVTRSGSNQFHGSAFEYLRNGKLNARNFFSSKQDTMNRNQFGFSLGGPIQKNKTFAFFSFQRTTQRYGTTSGVAYGPTAAELAGDWSGIPQQLYNTVLTRDATTGLPLTFTTDPTQKVPFVNNQIPTSLYVPLALKIWNLVPRGDPDTGKITYTKRTMRNVMQYVGRVDRNFSDKFHISGSFLRDTYSSPATEDPTNALTVGIPVTQPSMHVALNATYSLSPNLVTTLGATLSRSLYFSKPSTTFPSYQQLGANFPNWNPPGVWQSGGYDGFHNWQGGGPYEQWHTQLDFTNNWTYIRGNHTLEFGGEVVESQHITLALYWANGLANSWCGYTGYNPVDFVLGQNCSFAQYGPLYEAPRGEAPAIYINDKWKVKRGLTLSLGLRWEPWLPWSDRSSNLLGGVISAAAFANGTHSTRYPNLPPGYLVHGDPGVPDGLVPSSWALLDPRVGLAWDVRGDGKTSIRVGAGIYHDQPFGRMYNQMMTVFPAVSSYSIGDPSVPWYSPYDAAPFNGEIPALQVPVAGDSEFPSPFGYVIGFDPNFKPPATAQWHLTLEHELGRGFLLRTGYEAAASWHMYDSYDINSAVYIPGTNADGTMKSTPGNAPQRRPWYPTYMADVIVNEANSTSNYQALAISVEKRMTGSLSLVGGYRWAKCLDLGITAGVYANEFTDPTNRLLDRGLCNSDIASQAKLAVVYRLPALRSWGFVGRNVLGGWTMSGIWQWRDGYPYTIAAKTDSNLNGSGGDNGDRPDLVGDPNLPEGRSQAEKVKAWFNTAAFQDTTPGMNGSAPRNFLRGPGYFNLDYSLIKSFPIPYGALKETQKIDFRAEFFNIFNHTNFGNPNYYMASGQFGQIQSAGSPRIIQFALKYIF